jgi:hypothetical protein
MYWSILGQFNNDLMVPHADRHMEQLSNKTVMSSSTGLFLFLLLCWRPNAVNHDTQQDSNSEGKEILLNRQ